MAAPMDAVVLKKMRIFYWTGVCRQHFQGARAPGFTQTKLSGGRARRTDDVIVRTASVVVVLLVG